jgi:hypothetical protein
MRLFLRRAVPGFLVLFTSALLTPGDGAQRGRAARAAASPRALALPFVVNQGQTDRSVRFYTKTPHGTVLVTDSGSLIYKRNGPIPLLLTESPITGAPTAIRGVDEAPTRVNVFRGNDPARWQRDVRTYNTVSLGEVFDDIDLTLHASSSGVEKIFNVAAGADPRRIRMRLDDVVSLAVDASGELVANIDSGEVRFSRPIAFQERDGARDMVDVAYRVDGSEYGFQLGEYDRARPLIIDPAIVSTFLGGSGEEESLFAMRHDGAGHVYVTGWTDSDDFPGVTSSSPDPETGGCHNTDAYVAKLDDTLGTIVSATFLGGSFGTTLEAGEAIAFGPAGEVYVAGYTVSEDFPGITSGSPDATLGGTIDGFVVRLDNNLSTILGATYIGGSGRDQVEALVYDNATATLYAGGFTNSSNFPLVGCTASHDCTQEDAEGFVMQLNATITGFVRSTLIGGDSGEDLDLVESVLALAVDQAGNLYAGGITDSPDVPFITGQDTTYEGTREAFLIKFAPNLVVAAGTFFGGNGAESITALGVVENGATYAVFAAGLTGGGSGAGGQLLGITPSVADPHQNGVDAFVARFDANLNIVVTTYIGGNAHENGKSVAMAIPSGGSSVIVAGTTSATIFPGIDGLAADATVSNLEMFVVRVSADLTTFEGGSYVGGSLNDFGDAVAVDPSAGSASPVWVAGSTRSASFPGITSSSADSVFGGNDGLEPAIARLSSTLKSPLAELLTKLKGALKLVQGTSTPFSELTLKLGLAEALARRQNWQAATNQLEQFEGDVTRLVGERRLTPFERARLLEASAEVRRELDAARAEDDAGKRRGPVVPRIEPEVAPSSCPVLPPTRLP